LGQPEEWLKSVMAIARADCFAQNQRREVFLPSVSFSFVLRRGTMSVKTEEQWHRMRPNGFTLAKPKNRKKRENRRKKPRMGGKNKTTA